jgi:hypothetical protein
MIVQGEDLGRKAERLNHAARIRANSETTERLCQELAAAQRKLESSQLQVKDLSMQLARSVPVVQETELQAAVSRIQQARGAVCAQSKRYSEGQQGRPEQAWFDEVNEHLEEAFISLQVLISLRLMQMNK